MTLNGCHSSLSLKVTYIAVTAAIGCLLSKGVNPVIVIESASGRSHRQEQIDYFAFPGGAEHNGHILSSRYCLFV